MFNLSTDETPNITHFAFAKMDILDYRPNLSAN